MRRQKLTDIWWIRYFFGNFIDSIGLWGMWRTVFLLMVLFITLIVIFLITGNVAYTFGIFMSAISGIVLAFIGVALYVQDVYELNKTSTVIGYLMYALFGFSGSVERVVARNGELDIHDNEQLKKLELIGGPANITIEPGNVVVFENISGPTHISGGGSYTLSRFETVKEVVQLGDYSHEIDDVNAITRDGIQVAVSDIRYRYRMWLPRKLERESSLAGGVYNTSVDINLGNPFPFSKNSVRKRVYDRVISEKGPSSWEGSVQGIIVGTITGYFRDQIIDQIIRPHNTDLPNPRQAITERVETSTRSALREKGVDLLWFDIGKISFPDAPVRDQVIDNYLEEWEGSLSLMRIEGLAHRISNIEHGRAEAQNDLLKQSINIIEDIDTDADVEQGLKNFMLLRLTQIFESMTGLYKTTDYSEVLKELDPKGNINNPEEGAGRWVLDDPDEEMEEDHDFNE